MTITRTLSRLAAGLLLSAATIAPGVSASAQDVTIIDIGENQMTTRELTLPLGKAAIVELPRPASDILLSDPNSVEAVIRTPQRVYLMGREAGRSNVFFFDRNDNRMLTIQLSVEPDAPAIQSLVDRLVPDARVTAETNNGNVILHGTVANAGDAARIVQIAERYAEPDQIVNMVAVREPQQVMLKVRVVEMERRLIRQLGIDLNGVARLDDTIVDFAVNNAFGVSGEASGGLGGTVSTGGIGDISDLDFAFDVFEQNGLVKTLAEPNLVAISGETGQFLAGGSFPYPTVNEQGDLIIDFAEFGVKLNFTPYVFSKNRIRVKLETEVSELSQTNSVTFGGGRDLDPNTGEVVTLNSFAVPGLSKRNASSTVELPSGGAIALAGLLQENVTDVVDGVPGVKETPVLGALFRSKEFRTRQTELVIIATPYIVTPTSPEALTDPARGHVSPDTIQSLLLGRLEAAFGVTNNSPADRQLAGPYGFILD